MGVKDRKTMCNLALIYLQRLEIEHKFRSNR